MRKMLTLAVIVALLGSAGAHSLPAQAPEPREMLLVGEKSGALLAIIDPARGRQPGVGSWRDPRRSRQVRRA